jgi:cobalt/nickel transport system permease protein
MSDALLSPATGIFFWTGSLAAIACSAKKLRENMDDKVVPLMGVLGAFIFAAQMINFTIPGTGSSGHLGGGMILAIILGPYAAFLVMASVLTIQAFSLLMAASLHLAAISGTLGYIPVLSPILSFTGQWYGAEAARKRIVTASVISAVAGLQMGAISVVMQTLLSGQSELPFGSFVLIMQPIHLGIGLVEGFVTAGVINFVRAARPEILESIPSGRPLSASVSVRKVYSADGCRPDHRRRSHGLPQPNRMA